MTDWCYFYQDKIKNYKKMLMNEENYLILAYIEVVRIERLAT
jgi:hypothetical protein